LNQQNKLLFYNLGSTTQFKKYNNIVYALDLYRQSSLERGDYTNSGNRGELKQYLYAVETQL